MKIKLPILSIAAIIHIIYNIYFYLKYGKQGDDEGWGQLALMIMIGAGIVAILTDFILRKRIKSQAVFILIELALVVTGYIFFYIRFS
jgi:uncharacterized membrane protein